MVVKERDHDEDEQLAEGTLVSHLIELRQRLMYSVVAVLIIFVCLLPFQDRIFQFVKQPLENALPEGSNFIVTGIAEPFFVPFKTTMYVAVFLSMPVVLYQIWKFVAPGLYRREKRFAIPLVVSSIVLFYMGVAFAYFVVFKIMFAFFVRYTPAGVQNAPDIADFLSFVLHIFFAFGVAFEIPIATFMLVWSRLVPLKTLGKQRPYVFLGTFVIGMFLTPPDMFSQTLLALPMYLLYEGGLIFARIMLPERVAEERAAEAEKAAAEAAEKESSADGDD